MARTLKTKDVFVPGGMPTITYRSRADLESELRDHLDYGSNEVLSISGPTKTGKTVLVRHVLPDALVVEGGTVTNFDGFLDAVLDHFDVPTTFEHGAEEESATSRDRTGTVGAPAAAAYAHKLTDGTKDKTTVKQTTARSHVTAAREALSGGGVPLVVDDFHYILPAVQVDIVRFLKALVFDGLPVIFISVPHRAYDAVRVETEMTGRVRVLQVGFWSEDELRAIADEGFAALNVRDPGGAISRQTVTESFSSPHLMQQFCLGICRDAQVAEALSDPIDLIEPPEGWDGFFRRFASSSSKTAFDNLARGPRQRADRITRELRDGRRVDIYGVVLEAIAATGPLISITYEDLRSAIRGVIASDPPQRHEVTRVLDEMTKIAKGMDGEPVVDWDGGSMSTLHISDPYFAYYLRWGAREGVELSPRRASEGASPQP